jgi:hypothetical protein
MHTRLRRIMQIGMVHHHAQRQELDARYVYV